MPKEIEIYEEGLAELEELARSPHPLDFICDHKWSELGQRLYRVDRMRFTELVAKFEEYVSTVEDQTTASTELRKALETRGRKDRSS